MLIDHMVEYCDTQYQESINLRNMPNKCNDCNHPTSCKGDCKECLDQVHWLYEGGRTDYDCNNLLFYYTCRYSHKYCSEILYALEEIDLDEYPRYDILSIGCGAAPDLMAFEYNNYRARKPIRYRGYDRNQLWETIHDEIERYTSCKRHMDVKCRQKDIFDILSRRKPRPDFNVIVFEYLISHLYNTGQISLIDELFDGIISKVVSYRRPNSPMLIIINDIDSNRKGRDTFWRLPEKLQAAGFDIYVTAKYFKPECYLEGSTRHFYNYNRFSIPESIKDTYKCAIFCESAQLIVEVR